MNTAAEDDIPTFADWVARLGDVPLNRILMKPEPGTATVADVLAAEAKGHLCELVDGVLVEKVYDCRNSVVATWLASRILDFVIPRRLGVVTGAKGPLRMANGNIRLPNVAFAAWDQLPGGRVPDEPFLTGSPALVADMMAAGNTPGEMALKCRDYFASGTRLAWEIDARDRTVRVFASPDVSVVLGVDDDLDGGNALPGFTLPVRRVFEVLDWRAPDTRQLGKASSESELFSPQRGGGQ